MFVSYGVIPAVSLPGYTSGRDGRAGRIGRSSDTKASRRRMRAGATQAGRGRRTVMVFLGEKGVSPFESLRFPSLAYFPISSSVRLENDGAGGWGERVSVMGGTERLYWVKGVEYGAERNDPTNKAAVTYRNGDSQPARGHGSGIITTGRTLAKTCSAKLGRRRKKKTDGRIRKERPVLPVAI
jgi:hypothetical protein